MNPPPTHSPRSSALATKPAPTTPSSDRLATDHQAPRRHRRRQALLYAKNLNYFDAIFFFGVREITLTPEQRADLLSFVHDDGKGFVAAHAALTTFFSWPQFGEMLGGRFDEHPWGIINAPAPRKTALSRNGEPAAPLRSHRRVLPGQELLPRQHPCPCCGSTSPNSTSPDHWCTTRMPTGRSPGRRRTARDASTTPHWATTPAPGTTAPCRRCTTRPSSRALGMKDADVTPRAMPLIPSPAALKTCQAPISAENPPSRTNKTR